MLFIVTESPELIQYDTVFTFQRGYGLNPLIFEVYCKIPVCFQCGRIGSFKIVWQ